MACNSETPQYCAWRQKHKLHRSKLFLIFEKLNLITISWKWSVALNTTFRRYLASQPRRAREICQLIQQQSSRIETSNTINSRVSFYVNVWTWEVLEYSTKLPRKYGYTHTPFIASWADARFYRSLPLKTIPSRKSQNQNNGFYKQVVNISELGTERLG